MEEPTVLWSRSLMLDRPFRVPAVYTDTAGTVETVIENDGAMLTMQARGVKFEGRSFDTFEPASDALPEQLEPFLLFRNELVGYELRCDWPVKLLVQGQSVEAKLGVFMTVGAPVPGGEGRVDAHSLSLDLSYANKVYTFTPVREWADFETALSGLQAQMPSGVSFHACISCAFSDYSIYGQALFGSLACFRDTKEEYRQVRGKRIDALFYRMAGWVQETYLCNEFEQRVPGTGDRG